MQGGEECGRGNTHTHNLSQTPSRQTPASVLSPAIAHIPPSTYDRGCGIVCDVVWNRCSVWRDALGGTEREEVGCAHLETRAKKRTDPSGRPRARSLSPLNIRLPVTRFGITFFSLQTLARFSSVLRKLVFRRGKRRIEIHYCVVFYLQGKKTKTTTLLVPCWDILSCVVVLK